MAQKFTVPITVKQLTSAGSDAVTVYVDADTFARLKIEAGGRLVWGSGVGTGDVNLYRDSADVLRTDDTFKTPILFVDNIEIDPTGATTNQVLKFNGTKFIPDLSGGGLTVSLSAPVAPLEGDMWFNSETAKTYVYYDLFWVEIGGAGPQGPASPVYQLFTVPSTLNVGTGESRFYVPQASTILNIVASVGTAPTGSSIIVDVYKNGSTIFTTAINRPTIGATMFLDSSSVPDVTNLVHNDYLTIGIVQVGSTIPGSNLTVQIELQPT